MRKITKKLLSVILALMTVMSVMVVAPMRVSAYSTGNDYPYPNGSYGTYRAQDVDRWRYYVRECTSFVAWCLESRNELAGFTNWYKGVNFGDAVTWSNAAKSVGITVDNNPAVGAVAWWSFGHVAWVKSVNGNNVDIEEYNYDYKGNYNSRTVNKSTINGFIHFKDINTTPATRADNIGDDFYALIVNGYGVLTSENSATKFKSELKDNPQIMHFQRNADDDTYCITVQSDGKALDVAEGNKQQSRVYFYPLTKGDNQRFRIEKKDNRYMLSPKSGVQWVLDAGGGQGNFADGSRIWTYSRNDGAAQWFEIRTIDINTYAPKFSTKADNIGDDFDALIVRDTGGILTNVNSITKWDTERRDKSQVMHFQRQSDGSYKVSSLADNKCLDVSGASSSKETKIQFYSDNGNTAQRWRIEQNGNKYMFGPVCAPAYVLDVAGRGFADGTDLWTYTRNDGAAQWVGIRKIPDDYLKSPAEDKKEDPTVGDEPTVEDTTNSTHGLKNGIVLTATVTEIGVKFDWEPNDNALGYRIYRSKTPGVEGISITDFPITAKDGAYAGQYVDVNANSNTQYYYTIRKVEAEAGFNRETVEIIPERLGESSEELPVLTSVINEPTPPKPPIYSPPTNTEPKKNFILMTIGSATMLFNDEEKEIDPGRSTAPVIQDGRTLTPIRAIVESMQGTVDWAEAESKVTLAVYADKLEMWINSKRLLSNGAEKEMDIAPTIINARTMLPLRFVSDNVGCEIAWIGSSRQIIIVFYTVDSE